MSKKNKVYLLDCTLRDGGYYNNWDFSKDLIEDYLDAMVSIQADFVEIGFRFVNNLGFKGACAFSKDDYINSLSIPSKLKNKIGVMVNGADILSEGNTSIAITKVLKRLFSPKSKSPISLVRIACHTNEFERCLIAVKWLKKQGYKVGLNLMQISNISEEKIIKLLKLANNYPIDVLYFADSMGSLNPNQTSNLVNIFKKYWLGEVGIHAHDSMGNAIKNSMQAICDGATWVDCTVTGMGRGPGNSQTEYLSIELDSYRNSNTNKTKLLKLIRKHFKPLKEHFGWGMNAFYFLAGKYSIHPTYIQKMSNDKRFNEEDIISVIDYLKMQSAGKFNKDILETARYFYSEKNKGTWEPVNVIRNNLVLIIGSGPSIHRHTDVIESFIKKYKPYVIALNAQKSINEKLINVRAACHPVRVISDCNTYQSLPQPLITPVSKLPLNVKEKLKNKKLFDFDMTINNKGFSFYSNYCVLPNFLALSYSLAIASSGKAKKILLAGFDGYKAGDPRTKEIDNLFSLYKQNKSSIEFLSITDTVYEIPVKSIYGIDF